MTNDPAENSVATLAGEPSKKDAPGSLGLATGYAPFFRDEYVTIYHGDCREIVPALGRFDLLLTDPPYGIGRDGSKRTTSRHGGRKAYDFLGWDAERPPTWLLQMLLAAADKHIVWGGTTSWTRSRRR